jgi:hypothetical protein
MMMLRTSLCFALAVLLTAPAFAQGATLSASLSPVEIPYHRAATYTLRIEAPAGQAFEFPDLGSANPDLNVRKGELRTTETDDKRQVLEQDYTVDAIRPGAYVLPGQSLDLGGGPQVVPPMVLSVRDLSEQELAAAGEFESITSLETIVPPEPTPWWQWVAGIALVAALLAGIVYLVQRRRRAAPPPPPEPAWVVAERRLNELASRQLPQGGKHEAYYVDLTAILRYYIEDRFHIRAPEQTTPEFLESASQSGRLTESQQQVLSGLLRHGDRVKFARYEPTLEEMEESFRVVAQFVRGTVPLAQPQTRDAA